MEMQGLRELFDIIHRLMNITAAKFSENNLRTIGFMTIQVILLFCLFSYCKQKSKDLIKIKGLPENGASLVLDYIENLRVKNSVFSLILEELSEPGFELTLNFSDQVKIAGFLPKNDSIFNLYFKSLEEFQDENTILEEFFHAFQANFYGYKKLKPNEEGVIKGAANFEYEARLMKSLSALYHDQAFFETPSQKGLLDFSMSLLDESGKLNTSELDSLKHQQYIKLVVHFQQHWKKRNKQEHLKSIYDHPVDSSQGPDACFYLFQKLDKENS